MDCVVGEGGTDMTGGESPMDESPESPDNYRSPDMLQPDHMDGNLEFEKSNDPNMEMESEVQNDNIESADKNKEKKVNDNVQEYMNLPEENMYEESEEEPNKDNMNLNNATNEEKMAVDDSETTTIENEYVKSDLINSEEQSGDVDESDINNENDNSENVEEKNNDDVDNEEGSSNDVNNEGENEENNASDTGFQEENKKVEIQNECDDYINTGNDANSDSSNNEEYKSDDNSEENIIGSKMGLSEDDKDKSNGEANFDKNQTDLSNAPDAKQSIQHITSTSIDNTFEIKNDTKDIKKHGNDTEKEHAIIDNEYENEESDIENEGNKSNLNIDNKIGSENDGKESENESISSEEDKDMEKDTTASNEFEEDDDDLDLTQATESEVKQNVSQLETENINNCTKNSESISDINSRTNFVSNDKETLMHESDELSGSTEAAICGTDNDKSIAERMENNDSKEILTDVKINNQDEDVKSEVSLEEVSEDEDDDGGEVESAEKTVDDGSGIEEVSDEEDDVEEEGQKGAGSGVEEVSEEDELEEGENELEEGENEAESGVEEISDEEDEVSEVDDDTDGEISGNEGMEDVSSDEDMDDASSKRSLDGDGENGRTVEVKQNGEVVTIDDSGKDEGSIVKEVLENMTIKIDNVKSDTDKDNADNSMNSDKEKTKSKKDRRENVKSRTKAVKDMRDINERLKAQASYGEDLELDYDDDHDETKDKQGSDEEGAISSVISSLGRSPRRANAKTPAWSSSVDTQSGSESDDGELVEEEDCEEGEIREPGSRPFIKPTCRFFMRGHCTWGINCRFLHPGVNDKGNYQLIERPGYNNKPPPPYEEQPEEEERTPSPEPPPPPVEPKEETAWERGLRQAKELRKKALERRELEPNFEHKKLNLSIDDNPEYNKENTIEREKVKSPVKKQTYFDKLEPLSDDEYYDQTPIRQQQKQQTEQAWMPGQYENFEVRWSSRDPYYMPPGPPHQHYPNQGPPASRYPPYQEQSFRGRGRYPPSRPPPRRFSPSPPPQNYQSINDAGDKYRFPRQQREMRVDVRRDKLRERHESPPSPLQKQRPPSSPSKIKADEWHDPWTRSNIKKPTKSPGKKRSRSRGRRRSRRRSHSYSSSYSSSSYSGSSRSRSSSYSSVSSRSRSRSRSSSFSSRSPTPRRNVSSDKMRRPQQGIQANKRMPQQSRPPQQQRPPQQRAPQQRPPQNRPPQNRPDQNRLARPLSSRSTQQRPNEQPRSAVAVHGRPGRSPEKRPGTVPQSPNKVSKAHPLAAPPGRAPAAGQMPDVGRGRKPDKPGGPPQRKFQMEVKTKDRPLPPSALSKEKNRPRGRTASSSSSRSRSRSSSSSSRSSKSSFSSRSSHSYSRSRSRSSSTSSSGSADSDHLYRNIGGRENQKPNVSQGRENQGQKPALQRGKLNDKMKPRNTGALPDRRQMGKPNSKTMSLREGEFGKPMSAQPQKPKDPLKVTGQKSNIKLTLIKPSDKSAPTGPPEPQSKKRAADTMNEAPPAKRPSIANAPKLDKPVKKQEKPVPASPVKAPVRVPVPPKPVATPGAAPVAVKKKSTVSRREELLKQLKAVEDAIAKKKKKMN